MRPSRIIVGRAYPLSVKASNTIFDSKYDRNLHTASFNNPEARHKFYHDSSTRLAKPDVKRFVGKPIRFEHDPDINVGEITDTWTDKNGHMWMSSRIYTDTAEGRAVMNGVDSGTFRGLSVGMNPHISHDDRFVLRMEPEEISIVEEGYYKGSRLAIAASGTHPHTTPYDANHLVQPRDILTDSTNYKNSERIFFKFHNQMTDKSVEPKPDQGAEELDMTEIARQHDKVLQDKAEVERKNAELQKMVDEFKKREADEKKNYETKRTPEAEETLAILTEQLRVNTGNPEAQLDEQYATFVRNSFLAKETEPTAVGIQASAKAWKSTHEENKKNLVKLEQHNAAVAQIQASNRAKLFNQETEPAAKQEVPAIAASNGGSTTSNEVYLSLFGHAPSELEKQILTLGYPGALGAHNKQLPGIMASNGQRRVIPKAPTHNQVDCFPNSWRRVSPELFDVVNTMNPSQAFAYELKISDKREDY